MSSFTCTGAKRQPLHQEFILKNLKPIECVNRSIFNDRNFTVDFDESWMLVNNPSHQGSCTYTPLKSAKITKTSSSDTEFPIVLSRKAVFTFESPRYIDQHINSLKEEFANCKMGDFIDIQRGGNVVTMTTTDKNLKENDMYLLSFEFREKFLGVVVGGFFCKKNFYPDAQARPIYYRYRSLPTISC